MHYFDELGCLIGRLWKERDYDHRRFPEAAGLALSALPPVQHSSLEDAVQFGLTREPLPFQEDIAAQFGQPPLTVYCGRDFMIEVLFWVRATPAIHQHSFSGVFYVLHGSSLHLSWEFEPKERVVNHLLYGAVNLKKAEILNTGESRSIIAGDEFIHTTFHLAKPTISIVVRTLLEEDKTPQYVYLPPSICFDSYDRLPSLKRREQILHMLLQCDRMEQYRKMMRHLLATSDTYAVFRYLSHASAFIKEKQEYEQILSEAAVRSPALIENLAPALNYSRRQARIAQMREKISDPDLSFFLALLANIVDRTVVLNLLGQRYSSQDAVTVFSTCIKQLSDQNILGVQFNPTWLLMLEAILRSTTEDGNWKQVFEKKCGEDQVRSQLTKLQNLALTLQQFWLLEPLLKPSAPQPFFHAMAN